jgi:uncharacterized protein
MTNIEVAQHLYQSFFRGDTASILNAMDDDVDWIWHGPKEIPWAGHHQGREAVGEFFGKVTHHAEVLVYEPREFIAGENGVVNVSGPNRRAIFGNQPGPIFSPYETASSCGCANFMTVQ